MRKLISIFILAALASPALAENATIFVRPGDRLVRMCGGDTGTICEIQHTGDESEQPLWDKSPQDCRAPDGHNRCEENH
jgi:hypothetical protein